VGDISFGRSPNGSGSFTMLAPTFNTNNDFPNSVDQIFKEEVMYPNPFTDVLYNEINEDIEVRDILGKLICSFKDVRRLKTSDWESGVYFIYLKSKKKTVKVIKI
jgi:hypothetical protein